jgi:exoribonuclease-2
MDDDHESGVIRALFKSRRHFKFKPDRFLPHTEAQVAAIIAMEQKADRQKRLIAAGAEWIRSVQSGATGELPACHRELVGYIQILLPVDKDSPHDNTARAIMKKAGLTSSEAIFNHLVAVGVWTPDENVDLLRYKIPTDFSPAVLELAQSVPTADTFNESGRVDLTHLNTIHHRWPVHAGF